MAPFEVTLALKLRPLEKAAQINARKRARAHTMRTVAEDVEEAWT